MQVVGGGRSRLAWAAAATRRAGLGCPSCHHCLGSDGEPAAEAGQQINMFIVHFAVSLKGQIKVGALGCRLQCRTGCGAFPRVKNYHVIWNKAVLIHGTQKRLGGDILK